MRTVKCKVWNDVECKVQSVKCRVWSVKCSVEYGVLSVKCEV